MTPIRLFSATFVVASLLLASTCNAQESWQEQTDITRHSATAGYGKGMMCKDHPLKKHYKFVSGEIMRSWIFSKNKDGSQRWYRSAYKPRHNFKLVSDDGSNKVIQNLDAFGVFNGLRPEQDWVTLHFQRSAKVYMYVGSWDRITRKPYLSGWNYEGLFKAPSRDRQVWTSGKIGARSAEYRVHLRGVLFSKVVRDKVTIPTRHWVRQNVRNAKVGDGYYNIFIAEANGRPTYAPRKPWQFRGIQPGKLCPERLHNWWRVPGEDPNDRYIRGRLFNTWHPLWDPCFWCSYGHEHGSSAPLIMDYYPRYDYTALKNFNQDEAHKGFKDYVFDFPKYYIYYGTHAHVSDYGRFETRFHTNVFVARNKRTWKIEMVLSFKSDYGSLIVRDKDRKKIGVTPAQEKLRREIGVPRKMRIVNVLNYNRLSPRFLYRPRRILLHGLYEQWATAPICAKTTNYLEPTIDIKDPVMAMKNPVLPACGKRCNVQLLGSGEGKSFIPQASIDREFRVTNMMFDINECKFRGTKSFKGGYFYTDPYASEIRNGPGRHHIRQYIKPGFRYPVTGFYNTLDTWQGLYQKGAKGHFQNVGYGIDELSN